MRFYQSFVFKFLALLVLVLVLVVAASGWLLLDRNSRSSLQIARASNENALNVVQTLANASLSAFANNLMLMATVSDLTEFDPVRSARYLKSYKVSAQFIAGESLALYDNQHRLVADNTMVGKSKADLVFHGQAQSLRATIGALRWVHNAPVKSFAVTVPNPALADGILVADYSFKRLWSELLEYGIGETGYVILVNGDGTVLFHPQVTEWLSGPVSIEKLGLENFDPVRYNAPSSYVRLADGMDYLVSYTYNSHYQFGILAVQPRTQIENTRQLILRSMLYLLIAVVLATLLAAAWLRLYIGRPLNHLIARMKQVHNGDLDAESNIHRSDEIGLFASEFDLMRISLRQSIQELADHKASLEETVKARTQALQKANRALKLMSHTDHLTGIPNRRDIMEKVHYEMFRAERTHKPFSFLFADIDKFKNFNDTYGHDCGDVVLKTVAQVMRSMLRKPDYIARWGGEEFLVVLPETSLENATLVADRIRIRVADTEFSYAGHIFKVTITLGVAQFDQRLGIEHSINLADKALYRGKEAGRNRVEIWNPQDISDEDLMLAQKIREDRGGREFPDLDALMPDSGPDSENPGNHA